MYEARQAKSTKRASSDGYRQAKHPQTRGVIQSDHQTTKKGRAYLEEKVVC